MTYVSWNSSVNTNFFNCTYKIKDNSVATEYTSGRKTYHLANTRFLKEYELYLDLDVKSGEFLAFVTWYSDVLCGLSQAFKCSAIGDGYYRFTETPSFTSGLLHRTATLKIEEVY